MGRIIKIKKGLNIPLNGRADEQIVTEGNASMYGIVPDDFPGYTWKVSVKIGDKVKAGEPLLYAKENESLCLTSPTSGNVTEIRRGARRKIEVVTVKSDANNEYTDFSDLISDQSKTLDVLMRTGLFGMIRQRPFDIIPSPEIAPRDIFVTAFDSAPLAPSMVTPDIYDNLETGLKILSSLTEGKVWLSKNKDTRISSKIAEVIEFDGPHPSGNVGTQIAALAPVNKGETVWTLDIVTVARIGNLFSTGKIDYSTRVALTGPDIVTPHIVKTAIGASITELLDGQIKDTATNFRIISGNVLTGIKENKENGFLRYPYRQITVIDEGNDADEFMGWASINPNKYSVKRSFPAFLRGLSKPFNFDARIKGGHRAMILSGEYDKVFPMDIYPEYLIKAIMAKDIEKMEQLGIYEVAPEDFALPEFVDTSKIELQKLIREGLDYLRKETI